MGCAHVCTEELQADAGVLMNCCTYLDVHKGADGFLWVYVLVGTCFPAYGEVSVAQPLSLNYKCKRQALNSLERRNRF